MMNVPKILLLDYSYIKTSLQSLFTKCTDQDNIRAHAKDIIQERNSHLFNLIKNDDDVFNDKLRDIEP